MTRNTNNVHALLLAYARKRYYAFPYLEITACAGHTHQHIKEEQLSSSNSIGPCSEWLGTHAFLLYGARLR